MLQLEKKLFDYFNQEVFRDDNGTAVSPAMRCVVGPPPLLWAVLTPGPPVTSGWALPGVPPASGQAGSGSLLRPLPSGLASLSGSPGAIPFPSQVHENHTKQILPVLPVEARGSFLSH